MKPGVVLSAANAATEDVLMQDTFAVEHINVIQQLRFAVAMATDVPQSVPYAVEV
jgi:hypothetical protein